MYYLKRIDRLYTKIFSSLYKEIYLIGEIYSTEQIKKMYEKYDLPILTNEILFFEKKGFDPNDLYRDTRSNNSDGYRSTRKLFE